MAGTPCAQSIDTACRAFGADPTSDFSRPKLASLMKEGRARCPRLTWTYLYNVGLPQ
jgi:hypothetical protein